MKLGLKQKLLALIPLSLTIALYTIRAAGQTCTEYIFNTAWGPLYWIICR